MEAMKRECGILLPVSSLPSKYGIGAFSREAYEFIDTLEAAGQQYWQILPLGPTGFGDSPYQSFSAFAGNPFFIDLEQLVDAGLLTQKECDLEEWGDDLSDVDYDAVKAGRLLLHKKAYERWRKDKTPEEVHKLAEECLTEDTREYCFFMALKDHFQSASWNLWEEDIRMRKPAAMEEYGTLLSEERGFYEFQQIFFKAQWLALKGYANSRGIRVIGDIPIYVAFDGADSWAHPELFQFDSENLPVAVAGCPPDAFSATGQLWGNPLYNWEYHKKTGYQWWLDRMAYCFELYDVVRVDHFRGFDEYYSIPYGDATAEGGHWEKGPGLEIFKKMEAYFGTEELPIIAEDLGFLTPTVLQLLKDSGFPGMKILEFAFDASEDSSYLTHKYDPNCVVYTGTHDNDTAAGWFASLDKRELDFVCEYMGSEKGDIVKMTENLVRLALASPAALAIVPVQDYLALGTEARINEPSTVGTNWRWRLVPGQFGMKEAARCRRMAGIYGRSEDTNDPSAE